MSQKKIYVMKYGDQVLSKSTVIEKYILDYYMNLFGSRNACLDNDLIDNVILAIVSPLDNAMLTNLPSLD